MSKDVSIIIYFEEQGGHTHMRVFSGLEGKQRGKATGGKGMTEPTKQLGDDWDLDKLNPTQILDDLNYALLGEWEKMGYVRGHNMKVKVTVPVRKIEELKRRVIGSAAGAVTIWDWLHWNNKMRANDVPFEILPRYSFKDVVGTFDAVKMSAFHEAMKFETEKQAQAAFDAFSPVTATGEQLDRILDLVPSPVVRMRLEEGDPDAVPDRILGGWMESDDSLRKRVLAYHREQHPLPSGAPLERSPRRGPRSPRRIAETQGQRDADVAKYGRQPSSALPRYSSSSAYAGKDATIAAGAFMRSQLEMQDRFQSVGFISREPYVAPPRRPKPAGPDRYEMNDDRMTCFDYPDEPFEHDAPFEFTEWISVQDYEAAIVEKDAEIKALEIQLGKLIVPPHEFRPFGAKKIWCDLCGQREGAKTHPQEGK